MSMSLDNVIDSITSDWQMETIHEDVIFSWPIGNERVKGANRKRQRSNACFNTLTVYSNRATGS